MQKKKKITAPARRDNSADGRKAHHDERCYKVGRIRHRSWATRAMPAGDIVVYERELVHINNQHGKELRKLGLTPLAYVQYVAASFNEVYQSTGNSLLLVVRDSHVSQMAALQVALEKPRRHKIKTATPVKNEWLLNKKLLCANVH